MSVGRKGSTRWTVALGMGLIVTSLLSASRAVAEDTVRPVTESRLRTSEELSAALMRGGEYHLDPGTYTVIGEIPATVTLRLSRGALLDVPAGQSLNVYGQLVAGDYQQIFTGEGDLQLFPTAMRYVSVWHFGVVPGEDCADKLERLIKCSQRIASVYWPQTEYEKPYVTSRTITYFSPLRVGNWHVFGSKPGDGAQYQEPASRIVFTGKSGPCFNFRGQRLGRLSNLCLVGPNKAPAIMSLPPESRTLAPWKLDNWISEGLSNDQYDHLAGLAFDWVGGTADSKHWSAQFQVDNVMVSGFVVGVSISPNRGYQADTIDFNKVKVIHCAYAFSIGQDQVRAVSFTNCWVDSVFCAFVNNRYGRSNGSAFSVFGGQYTGCFKLFEVTTAYRGQMVVSGMFAEGCGMLGSIRGLGVNANSAVFTGCEFGFDNNGYVDPQEGGWVTPWTWLEAGANLTFVGCNLHARRQVLGVYVGGLGAVTFQGCSLSENYIIAAGGLGFEQRLRFTQTTSLLGWKPDQEVTLAPGERVTGRATAELVRRWRPQGETVQVTTEPTRFTVRAYRPSWQHLGTLAPADNQERTVTRPVTKQIADLIKIGDLSQCYLGQALEIDGMVLNAGELEVPGLLVMAKTDDSVTLQRLAPEIDLSRHGFYGGAYQIHQWEWE